MDAHAENEVHPGRERRLGGRFGRGLGIEGQTDLERLLARKGDDAPQIRTGLVVDGDAVGARLAELLEMSLGASIIRWQSSTPPAAWTIGEIDWSTIGPTVIGGTKCPSPTSKWNTRTSARSSTSICSPRREKSAAYSDGSTSMVRIQSCQLTRVILGAR